MLSDLLKYLAKDIDAAIMFQVFLTNIRINI